MEKVSISSPHANLVLNESVEKENITPRSKMKTGLKFGNSSSIFGSPMATKSFKILSDEEMIHNSKKKSSSANKVKNAKRRSLATLQPSTSGKGTLVGKGREPLSIKEAFSKKNKTNADIEINIDDKKSTNKSKDVEVSADDQLAQEAIELMKATETVDDSYWKSIAEERRIALEDVLFDNEKLYSEIDNLTEQNQKLKKDLSEAQYFKILYHNLLEQVNSKVDE